MGGQASAAAREAACCAPKGGVCDTLMDDRDLDLEAVPTIFNQHYRDWYAGDESGRRRSRSSKCWASSWGEELIGTSCTDIVLPCIEEIPVQNPDGSVSMVVATPKDLEADRVDPWALFIADELEVPGHLARGRSSHLSALCREEQLRRQGRVAPGQQPDPIFARDRSCTEGSSCNISESGADSSPKRTRSSSSSYAANQASDFGEMAADRPWSIISDSASGGLLDAAALSTPARAARESEGNHEQSGQDTSAGWTPPLDLPTPPRIPVPLVPRGNDIISAKKCDSIVEVDFPADIVPSKKSDSIVEVDCPTALASAEVSRCHGMEDSTLQCLPAPTRPRPICADAAELLSVGDDALPMPQPVPRLMVPNPAAGADEVPSAGQSVEEDSKGHVCL
eukprot:TRINITY_DN74809_c0_g1_i1.p1 TRINITY_DN74809_c0_g1~~TRINITY_DN74809_c0_g1_i1.p1  ORF type:complete len:395 (+),score=58.94 TRINITY_DN74809_c0_g1_i1:82-1266(+)